MSSANVDLVRSLYEAWRRGDWSSVDWADPDIQFAVGDGPDAGELSGGVSALGEAWREFLGTWDGWSLEIEEIREVDGERVLALVRVAGRGRASGLDTARLGTEIAANLFQVRDGKVTRLVIYWDSANALADLGLASAPDTATD